MWETNTERIFNNPEKLLLSKQKKKEVEKLKLENKYWIVCEINSTLWLKSAKCWNAARPVND